MKKIFALLFIVRFVSLDAMQENSELVRSNNRTLAQAGYTRYSITVTPQEGRLFSVQLDGSDTFVLVKKKIYEKIAARRMHESYGNPVLEPFEPAEQKLSGFSDARAVENIDDLAGVDHVYLEPAGASDK